MISVSGSERFVGRDARRGVRFEPAAGCFRGPRTHSSQRGHQLPPGHPQVGQREQRVQLRGVLRQPAVPHLHMAELALDHPERVLAGRDTGCRPELLSGLGRG